MFKLKEKSKAYEGSLFAISISNDWETPELPYNMYNLRLGKYSWWWIGPKIVSPRKEWRDTSQYSWSNKEGGYWNYIRKQYGISINKNDIHTYYGIQPMQWISNDPYNSDHSKVYNYFWNFQQVRHDALYLDGKYLCPDRHRSKWQQLYFPWQNKTGVVKGKEREKLFLKYNDWFILPKSDDYANNYNERKNGTYDNWSSTSVDPCSIYKYCEYKDPYDNSITLARLNVEEREWIRGKWAWLRAFFKYIPGGRKIKRYLEIEFKDEVGPRKGSYKGGVLGCAEEFLPNETTAQCWKRFCKERRFT